MIYFDSAATTLQKPSPVWRASSYAMRHYASPGRGGYASAEGAEQTVYACREAAGKLFHVPAERVVFTSNATHGLNIAIKSVVRPGDTVLVSGYEHNAVSRPISNIEGVTVRIATSPLFQPEALLQSVRRQLDDRVSAVVMNHVSNVFGYILPVEEVASLCRERGIPFILDASQSAGTIPIDCEALGAQFVACPGHKGLYGPQGTGLLLCGERAPLHPLIEGGTGSLSASTEMPPFLPDRLEAGTHNVPGIAGLLEGIRFVMRKTPEAILKGEQSLARMTVRGLRQMGGVQVYAAEPFGHQSGVVSFEMDHMDCQDVAAYLAKRGIAVRAGLHCAPFAHASVGTLERGTVRVSFSAFNTKSEVSVFLQVMGALSRRRRSHLPQGRGK